MEFIKASKPGFGVKRFTKAAWDRLGNDRNGWKQLPAEAQDGKAPGIKTQKPGTPAATAEVATNPAQPKSAAELRKELEEAEKREAAAAEKTGGAAGEAERGTPKSTDGNVVKAVEHINTLESADAINAYIAGDERKTVVEGAVARIDNLNSN